MKRNQMMALIAVIAVIVIAGGAYLIFHKSNTPVVTSSTGTTSTSSTPSVNNSVLVTKTSSSLGKYLAEPNGMPLYTYASDTSGVSNCSGSCLATWPAYQDKGSTTNLPSGVSTITRKDNGEVQYAYNGLPLYTFVDDSSGNPSGDGVSNFKLAKPAATSTTTKSTSTTSTNSSNGSGY